MSEELKAAQARIAELEAWKAQEMQVMSPLMDYARGVCTGPLGCSLADWLVQDQKQLRAKLAAIKAQEPVAVMFTDGAVMSKEDCGIVFDTCCRAQTPLYAAPVAKPQVVIPERKTKADYGVYIDEFADEAAAIYNAALDEVARLNAAPTAPAADAGLVEALTTVAHWHLPETGQFWPSGGPVSYEAQYGSNGARDYMRGVAQAALAAHRAKGVV